MAGPLVLHCNYVEQGQSVAAMCRLAQRWGYAGIEFRQRRYGITEDPTEYLEAVAAGVRETGLEVVLFGAPGPNLMLPADADRQREVELYEQFLRAAAARLPLTVLNAFSGGLTNPQAPPGAWEQHGSACASAAHWEQAVAGYQHLAAVATELGLRLAFETHMNYLHDLAEPACALCEQIGSPAVGVNLDYANIHHFPRHPSASETIAQCGQRLYLVHLKNVLTVAGPAGSPPLRVRCGLADGEINTRAFLRELFASGYDGPLVLEAPRDGDREWFAQQDLAYCRALLADLGAL
ncbi:MAG: sugar phosphate isomerase/epimerase [Fimbriimonadaceae bacterium]|nr:sugar phosphate isomerase/epimerase [Fimbriimonadaceae bacterium]